MWSTEAAKSLILQARGTDDTLTHRLADYLGYALETVDYYERLVNKMKKKTAKKAKK